MTGRQQQPEDCPESALESGSHEERPPEEGHPPVASQSSEASLPAWARSPERNPREDDPNHTPGVPSWARPGGAARTRPGGWRGFLRRWLLWPAVVLLVLFGVWSNYPFIPNPLVALFRQPGGDATSVSSPESWAMYGANPQGTNYIANAAPPKGVVAYSMEVDGEVRSAPVVSGGVVYIGGQSRIAAYAADTGNLLWERKVDGPAHGTPAVTVGDTSETTLVYLGLLGTNILALDSETGRTVWEYDGDSPFPGTVTVQDGILYAASRGGQVHAIDADSGDLLWKVDTGGPVVVPVAIHDGKMFAASTAGVLYIRNARTGDKRARIRTGGAIVSPPVVDGERVFLVFEGDLLAFDNTIREMPGRYPAELVWAQLWIWGFPLPPPPEHAGLQWRVTPGEGLGDFAHPPAVTPEALYLGTDLGVVLALEPDGGRVLWRMEPGPPVSADDGRPGKVAAHTPYFLPPIVAPVLAAGDLLLLAYADNTIRAVNRFTREEVWALNLGSRVVAPLSYADGAVYAHTEDGKLHVIR